MSIHYVNQNYLEFETEDRFDLILMIFCDYCALSPAQRRTMLRKFHLFLKPGGQVLLDVHSLAAYEQHEVITRYEVSVQNGFWSASRYFTFLNTFKYEKEKVSLDKYTIVEADRCRTIYNWLQYFSPTDIISEFEENGFKIENLYSDVPGKLFNPQSSEFAVGVERVALDP